MKREKSMSQMSETYFIVRGTNSGVFFACNVKRVRWLWRLFGDGKEVKMGWSRMIHRWEGAAALSQVSVDGIKSGHVCVPVWGRIVLDVCEIIPCTQDAVENLLAQPEWRA